MADAETPLVGSDVDVFYGGPGFGLEGGGALAQLAGEEAYYLPVPLCDKEARVGARREVGQETAHDLLGVGSGGVDRVVEGMLSGALHPKPGGGIGVVPPPGADREAYLALSAAFLHAPIVAEIPPLVARSEARFARGEQAALQKPFRRADRELDIFIGIFVVARF